MGGSRPPSGDETPRSERKREARPDWSSHRPSLLDMVRLQIREQLAESDAESPATCTNAQVTTNSSSRTVAGNNKNNTSAEPAPPKQTNKNPRVLGFAPLPGEILSADGKHFVIPHHNTPATRQERRRVQRAQNKSVNSTGEPASPAPSTSYFTEFSPPSSLSVPHRVPPPTPSKSCFSVSSAASSPRREPFMMSPLKSPTRLQQALNTDADACPRSALIRKKPNTSASGDQVDVHDFSRSPAWASDRSSRDQNGAESNLNPADTSRSDGPNLYGLGIDVVDESDIHPAFRSSAGQDNRHESDQSLEYPRFSHGELEFLPATVYRPPGKSARQPPPSVIGTPLVSRLSREDNIRPESSASNTLHPTPITTTAQEILREQAELREMRELAMKSELLSRWSSTSSDGMPDDSPSAKSAMPPPLVPASSMKSLIDKVPVLRSKKSKAQEINENYIKKLYSTENTRPEQLALEEQLRSARLQSPRESSFSNVQQPPSFPQRSQSLLHRNVTWDAPERVGRDRPSALNGGSLPSVVVKQEPRLTRDVPRCQRKIHHSARDFYARLDADPVLQAHQDTAINSRTPIHDEMYAQHSAYVSDRTDLDLQRQLTSNLQIDTSNPSMSTSALGLNPSFSDDLVKPPFPEKDRRRPAPLRFDPTITFDTAPVSPSLYSQQITGVRPPSRSSRHFFRRSRDFHSPIPAIDEDISELSITSTPPDLKMTNNDKEHKKGGSVRFFSPSGKSPSLPENTPEKAVRFLKENPYPLKKKSFVFRAMSKLGKHENEKDNDNSNTTNPTGILRNPSKKSSRANLHYGKPDAELRARHKRSVDQFDMSASHRASLPILNENTENHTPQNVQITRSQSLRYIDDAVPPTPPSRSPMSNKSDSIVTGTIPIVANQPLPIKEESFVIQENKGSPKRAAVYKGETVRSMQAVIREEVESTLGSEALQSDRQTPGVIRAMIREEVRRMVPGVEAAVARLVMRRLAQGQF
jgi:hypothetical protein